MEHWRESAEDDEEKSLFARIDAGEGVTAQEIARDRLLWGAPDDIIEQIQRYQSGDRLHARAHRVRRRASGQHQRALDLR